MADAIKLPPLPEPDGVIAAMWNVVRHGPNYDGRQNDVIAAAKAYAERHAAAVNAALQAECDQLRADAIDRQNNVVVPLRERVRVLEDALACQRVNSTTGQTPTKG